MERLQKILARAGFGSRRHCETLISAGRVAIDGVIVRELGTRADPDRSQIVCDGRPVRPQRYVYYAVHKPKGVVSTSNDPQGRKTVLDLLLHSGERVYCVGRLDQDSEGLLLVTNDGALCNLLTHPRYGVAKTYHVVAHGEIDGRDIERIQKGVWLSEGRTTGGRVLIKKRTREVTVLEVTIAEGMNREIRRIFAKIGHAVERLKRIRIGPIDLGDIPPGLFRSLSKEEVAALRAAATDPSHPRPAPVSRPEAPRESPPAAERPTALSMAGRVDTPQSQPPAPGPGEIAKAAASRPAPTRGPAPAAKVPQVPPRRGPPPSWRPPRRRGPGGPRFFKGPKGKPPRRPGFPDGRRPSRGPKPPPSRRSRPPGRWRRRDRS